MSLLPVLRVETRPVRRALPIMRFRPVLRLPLAGWRTLLGLAVGSGILAAVLALAAVVGMR